MLGGSCITVRRSGAMIHDAIANIDVMAKADSSWWFHSQREQAL